MKIESGIGRIIACYYIKKPPLKREGIGARDWIRTSTSLRTLRPEHSASTNFATRAPHLN